MGVVGDQEDAIAENGYAAIDAAGGVSDYALGERAGVVPDLASGAGVEGEGLIRSGDVHDAIDDDWRDLEMARAGNRERPVSSKARDVARVDLFEGAIA